MKPLLCISSPEYARELLLCISCLLPPLIALVRSTILFYIFCLTFFWGCGILILSKNMTPMPIKAGLFYRLYKLAFFLLLQNFIDFLQKLCYNSCNNMILSGIGEYYLTYSIQNKKFRRDNFLAVCVAVCFCA